LEREVTQEVTGNLEKLTIKYKNNNEFTNPLPPVFWGGDYINYLRVILPINAEIKDSEKYDIEIRDKFKIVGLWVTTPAQKSSSVVLEYKIMCSSCNDYQVLIKRQPGIEGFPYKLIYNGKIEVNRQIDKDVSFVVN
jgi:hypothetical protein